MIKNSTYLGWLPTVPSLSNVADEVRMYGLSFSFVEFPWESITNFSSGLLAWSEYMTQQWDSYIWLDIFFIAQERFYIDGNTAPGHKYFLL